MAMPPAPMGAHGARCDKRCAAAARPGLSLTFKPERYCARCPGSNGAFPYGNGSTAEGRVQQLLRTIIPVNTNHPCKHPRVYRVPNINIGAMHRCMHADVA